MGYKLIYPDDNEGFCESAYKDQGSHLDVWDIQTVVSFFCLVVVLKWVRDQYNQKRSGLFVPDHPGIFPIYLYLLVLIAVSELLVAMLPSKS